MASRRKLQTYNDAFAPTIKKTPLGTDQIDRQMRANQKRGGFKQASIFEVQEGSNKPEDEEKGKEDFKFGGGRRRKKKHDFSGLKRNQGFKIDQSKELSSPKKSNPGPRSFPKREVGTKAQKRTSWNPHNATQTATEKTTNNTKRKPSGPKTMPGPVVGVTKSGGSGLRVDANATPVKPQMQHPGSAPHSLADAPPAPGFGSVVRQNSTGQVQQKQQPAAVSPIYEPPQTPQEPNNDSGGSASIESKIKALRDEQERQQEAENYSRCIQIRDEIKTLEAQLNSEKQADNQSPEAQIVELQNQIKALEDQQAVEARKENFQECMNIRTKTIELEEKIKSLQTGTPITPTATPQKKQKPPPPTQPAPQKLRQQTQPKPHRISFPKPSDKTKEPEPQHLSYPPRHASHKSGQFQVVSASGGSGGHARVPSRLRVVAPKDSKQNSQNGASSQEIENLKTQLKEANQKLSVAQSEKEQSANRSKQMNDFIQQLQDENSSLVDRINGLEQQVSAAHSNLHDRQQSMAGKIAERDQRETKLSGMVTNFSGQTREVLKEQEDRHKQEIRDIERHYQDQIAQLQAQQSSSDSGSDWRCGHCGVENHASSGICAACQSTRPPESEGVIADGPTDRNAFKERLAAQLAMPGGGLRPTKSAPPHQRGPSHSSSAHNQYGGGSQSHHHNIYDQQDEDNNIEELENQLQEALSFCAKQKKTIEEQRLRINELEVHVNELSTQRSNPNVYQGGVADMNGNQQIIEGYLMKRDPSGPKMFRGWKKRWSVLSPTSLQYYESPADDSPKGEILISSIITVDRQISDKMKLTFCISVRESSRVYEFKAESSADCGNWVTLLKNQID